MATFTKHLGTNTGGTRLVVVFREIPDDEEHCLVVETDSLREMYQDQFMREVNSKDAQATVNLYEVLERRQFGDGTQMLNSLHNQGLLRKYPVKEINMTPMTNRLVPLSMVNDQIAGRVPTDPNDVEVKAADVVESTDPTGAGVSVDTDAGLVKTVLDKAKVDPVVIGQATNQTEEEATKVAAESKLLQARLMEEDAKKMREEAYTLDPALKKGGRPKKTT
jgi:hypothetical protein